MTEEEKMKFWGELVEPILALTGGLLMRGEDKLLMAFRDIVAKAETAALEEREACAKVCEDLLADEFITRTEATVWDVATLDCAAAIRARGQV